MTDGDLLHNQKKRVCKNFRKKLLCVFHTSTRRSPISFYALSIVLAPSNISATVDWLKWSTLLPTSVTTTTERILKPWSLSLRYSSGLWPTKVGKWNWFFFLRMEVSLRIACFVYCGKARATTTHESQQTKHSEALAYEHDTTAWYST